MDNITYVVDAQGEIIGERLRDGKFFWRERRLKTCKLARLYEVAGWQDYAKRAAYCSTWLNFHGMESGEKQLIGANFCHLRLCPLCTARRAKRAAYKLSQVLDKVEADHEGTLYLFLTLTNRNVPGDQLGESIGQLTSAWKKLIDHRQVKRSVRGWFRALEVTRNGDRKNKRWYGTYHPHIHAILAVEPAYFAKNSPLYITKDEWIRRWQLVLDVDYKPSIDIKTTKAKGEVMAGRAAAVEASKYAVKDSDYIDPKLTEVEGAQIVDDYTRGLKRRRLTAFGGWMKEAARALDAEDLDDGDLVHIDKDTIRADLADYIETYGWHFGAGDYVLMDRRVNPLKVVRQDER